MFCSRPRDQVLCPGGLYKLRYKGLNGHLDTESYYYLMMTQIIVLCVHPTTYCEIEDNVPTL